MKVVGHVVVVGSSPIFKLIGGDDRVVAFIKQFCSMNGFSLSHVSLAFFFDDFPGNFEADCSIDFAAFISVLVAGLFGIALDRGDFVV